MPVEYAVPVQKNRPLGTGEIFRRDNAALQIFTDLPVPFRRSHIPHIFGAFIGKESARIGKGLEDLPVQINRSGSIRAVGKAVQQGG